MKQRLPQKAAENPCSPHLPYTLPRAYVSASMLPLPLSFPSSSVLHLCCGACLKISKKCILARILTGMQTVSARPSQMLRIWMDRFLRKKQEGADSSSVLIDRGFLISSISSPQNQPPDITPLPSSVFHNALCCHHLITIRSLLWLQVRESHCHSRSKSVCCTVTWVHTLIPVWPAMALPVFHPLRKPRSLPSYNGIHSITGRLKFLVMQTASLGL